MLCLSMLKRAPYASAHTSNGDTARPSHQKLPGAKKVKVGDGEMERFRVFRPIFPPGPGQQPNLRCPTASRPSGLASVGRISRPGFLAHYCCDDSLFLFSSLHSTAPITRHSPISQDEGPGHQFASQHQQVSSDVLPLPNNQLPEYLVQSEVPLDLGPSRARGLTVARASLDDGAAQQRQGDPSLARWLSQEPDAPGLALHREGCPAAGWDLSSRASKRTSSCSNTNSAKLHPRGNHRSPEPDQTGWSCLAENGLVVRLPVRRVACSLISERVPVPHPGITDGRVEARGSWQVGRCISSHPIPPSRRKKRR